MISSAGNLALWLALGSGVAVLWSGLRAAGSRRDSMLRQVRAWVRVTAALLVVALGLLIAGLVVNDPGIRYVRAHSSGDTALVFRIAAAWSGQEGSLLLWTALVAVVGACVSLGHRTLARRLHRPRASAGDPQSAETISGAGMTLAVFGLLVVGLTAIMLGGANPFAAQEEVLAGDGHGLSPSLRHWAMIIHPPVQMLGYACCAAVFALAIGTAWSGRRDDESPSLRFWARLAWVTLGAGMLLGARWAYVELGWGGYWAWDPVENAALVPWLLCTGLVHSIAVGSRGTPLRAWVRALAMLPLICTIIGAWLTRSGAVPSVHAYSVSTSGHWLLALLAAVVALGSAVLVRARVLRGSEASVPGPTPAEGARSPRDLRLVCVEVGNGLLLFMSIATLAGMLAPVLSGVLGAQGPMGVGERYYSRTVLVPGAVCVLLMLGAPFVGGVRGLLTSRRRVGALVAHLGVLLLAVGVAGSTLLKSEQDLQIAPGGTVTLGSGGAALRLDALTQTRGHDYTGVVARLVLIENGRERLLEPEKRFSDKDLQPSAEVAIRSTLARDVYVALVGWEAGGSTVAVQVRVLPLVNGLWIGGALALLGAAICFAPVELARRVMRRGRATSVEESDLSPAPARAQKGVTA